ncbi:hypothetical protein TeGR_g7941 [Tetraparma gracilis]|uniref:Uncharacterized protein n=1 Tax=Tetraparma gracilis TaxID=2962635 RepID=A0ABQ6M3F4_9STRA|nr:hypothetical protein TeGR_g7941 [Tetraparma gracilis]
MTTPAAADPSLFPDMSAFEDESPPSKFPAASVSAAVSLLASISSMSDYKSRELKFLRQQLARVGVFAERDKFQGLTEEQFRQRQFDARNDKKREQRLKAAQQKHLKSTELRAGRIEALNSLIEAQAGDDGEGEQRLLAASGGESSEARGQLQYLVPDGVAQDDRPGSAASRLLSDGAEPVHLNKARSCYCCKKRYHELHRFYDQLCPPCAKLNWEKRFHSPELPKG